MLGASDRPLQDGMEIRNVQSHEQLTGWQPNERLSPVTSAGFHLPT